MIYLDFETDAIQSRPYYPPKPVGVAILPDGGAPRYLAWGHPTDNNCEVDDARKVLADIWAGGEPLCFFNSKFDLDVAQTHFGLPAIPWDRVHDPMFLLFLADPHAESFALKPASERVLGLPPSEQERVRDWLVSNGFVRANEKGWGAKIAQAPGRLVGEYACGDVVRTQGLHEKLMLEIAARGMTEAYDRERALMPILLDNERAGIHVDKRRLQRDVKLYDAALQDADEWLCDRLQNPDLNIESDRELAEALDKAGIVTDWSFTATGQRSVAKDKLLPAHFSDPEVYRVLNYRNRLATALGTFMEPWLLQAAITKGIVHTNWNQIRSFGQGKDFSGARTGRLSSNPNFQNLPKRFKYDHPDSIELPPLPLLRSYFLPDPGGMWIHRDYSQQEFRILAHFEDGVLAQEYCSNPGMDVHDYMRFRIRAIRGIDIDRTQAKILNFGMVYGMGLGKLAEGLGCSVEEARKVKDAQRAAIPGLGALEEDVRRLGRSGDSVRTWGGRQYHAEPPKLIDGEMRTFEYKLLNYLIQGSAADATKQALINYASAAQHGRILCTVHDEINISVPPQHVDSEMKILREAMAAVKFDVPMLSDGKTGTNWGNLKEYTDAN